MKNSILMMCFFSIFLPIFGYANVSSLGSSHPLVIREKISEALKSTNVPSGHSIVSNSDGDILPGETRNYRTLSTQLPYFALTNYFKKSYWVWIANEYDSNQTPRRRWVFFIDDTTNNPSQLIQQVIQLP